MYINSVAIFTSFENTFYQFYNATEGQLYPIKQKRFKNSLRRMGFNCLTSMPAKQFHTPTKHRFYINVDSHHDQQGLLHLCRLYSEIECLQQFQMLRDILYHVVSPICSPHPRLATGNLTWHHTVWAPSRYVICYKLPVRIKHAISYI